MFKGILPSKRVSTSDFAMITPLLDLNGKENLPGAGVPPTQRNTRSALGPNKAQLHVQEKKKYGDFNNGKECQSLDLEGPGMNQAFDRLLVRKLLSSISCRNLTCSIIFRMTCKFQTLCGPNLQAWMLLSKLPCSNLHK
jgi:hypothetical protein